MVVTCTEAPLTRKPSFQRLQRPLNTQGRKPSRMDDWFGLIDTGCKLSSRAVQDLCAAGFVGIPGPVAPDRLEQFAEAYDSAVMCAAADEVSTGRSTTRVDDFGNRGVEFDGLYLYGPVLEACCRIIGQAIQA